MGRIRWREKKRESERLEAEIYICNARMAGKVTAMNRYLESPEGQRGLADFEAHIRAAAQESRKGRPALFTGRDAIAEVPMAHRSWSALRDGAIEAEVPSPLGGYDELVKFKTEDLIEALQRSTEQLAKRHGVDVRPLEFLTHRDCYYVIRVEDGLVLADWSLESEMGKVEGVWVRHESAEAWFKRCLDRWGPFDLPTTLPPHAAEGRT